MAILKSKNGNEKIEYMVVRRNNMKTVRIKVKSDGSVVVSADRKVSIKFIEDFVERKSDWIFKSVAEAKRNQLAEYKLRDGCHLRIFGNYYQVKAIKCAEDEVKGVTIEETPETLQADNNKLAESSKFLSKNEPTTIIPENAGNNVPKLIFRCQNPQDEDELELLLLIYIGQQSRSYLTDLYNYHFSRLPAGTVKPRIVLKMLKSKWGHCDLRNQEIMFNFLMAKLPAELCEYIVVHEISHIFVQNHSPEFYAFGEKLLPGFRRLNKELKKYSNCDLLAGIVQD